MSLEFGLLWLATTAITSVFIGRASCISQLNESAKKIVQYKEIISELTSKPAEDWQMGRFVGCTKESIYFLDLNRGEEYKIDGVKFGEWGISDASGYLRWYPKELFTQPYKLSRKHTEAIKAEECDATKLNRTTNS